MSRDNRRVLFVTQTASPEGGVETWLEHVSAALEKHGWEPVVGLVRGAKSHNPERFMEHHPHLRSVVIDGRGLHAEGRVHAVLRCLKKVDPAICVPLTVIDAHEAVARAKGRFWQGRYLLTVPGNVPVQLADARRYQPFADLAVCPGALTCKLLDWAGMPSELVRHVPNGVRGAMQRGIARKKQVPIRLGYVGRLAGNEKRVQDLCALWEELERHTVDYTFTVAGDGGLRSVLEAKVDQLGIRERVTFLGRLHQDVLYENVYPKLDAVLIFSESEAYCITLVEAMMHGVVPVSSRYIGHRAEGFLQDGKTALLFDVGNMAEAVQQIIALGEDDALFAQVGKQAQEWVCDRYSWPKCCEGWLAAFDDILHLPRRIGNPLSLRPASGHDRLSELGVPPGLAFHVRRCLRAVAGVPAGMIGGEEWPFANAFHADATLREIEALSLQLDCAAGDALYL